MALAAVSWAAASLDPGVTRAHSCSDSLCKHPLPAALPPPPAASGPRRLPGPDPRVSRWGPPTTLWTKLGPRLWSGSPSWTA